MRCSEKRALRHACRDPRAAACAEQHGQTLHKKSTKHEFLVKPCADQRIENAKCCEFQISLYILKLAEVTAKPRLFRKIHGNENNSSERNTYGESAHPTCRPLQPGVGQCLAAQPDQSPRNCDQQHFANRVKDKSPLQIDGHTNQGTEKGVEKKRHRHKYHDVDHITPSMRAGRSFRSLNLAYRHSQELIISATDR